MTPNENTGLLLHFEQRYPGSIAGTSAHPSFIVGVVDRDLAHVLGRLRSQIVDAPGLPTISCDTLVGNLVDHLVRETHNLEAKLLRLSAIKIRTEIGYETACGQSWTVLRVVVNEESNLEGLDIQTIVDAYWAPPPTESFRMAEIDTVEFTRVSRRRNQGLLCRIVPARDPACVDCGITEFLEAAHIVPLAMGGRAELQNMISLCKNCHARFDQR